MTTPEAIGVHTSGLTWRGAYPGEWSSQNGYIWSDSLKGGQTTPCMVRGWGYLTGRGHGALGLSDNDALRIQAEVGSLIGAAPDLLEALQRMVAAYGDITIILDGVEQPETDPEIIAARAAIAKATGQ